MSETYNKKQINSFASIAKSFEKTIKSNNDFQKNLINSTNSFYLKMSKKFEENSKNKITNRKSYLDEMIKPFRDVAKSVRTISDNIAILIKRQTSSNQKVLANISGQSIFGSGLKARGKQKGFLQTLVRQRQMKKLGVSGVGIASPFQQGAKGGIFKGFMRAYKNVYNQWELPYQERMLQSLLDMKNAFVSSNQRMKQVWARLLIESPVFRTMLTSLKMIGKVYSFVYIKPLKWLFRERGAAKYGKFLPRRGTAFDKTAVTLGLLYTGSMIRLDRLIYYSGETLKQLELLTGRKVKKKKVKYSIFSRYFGGEKMKNYFKGLLNEGIKKLPFFGKRRKIKELKSEQSRMMGEQLSVPNLLLEQLSVLKGIYSGITGKTFQEGKVLRTRKERMLDIQDQLKNLMTKKRPKLEKLNQNILLKYEKSVNMLKQIGEEGTIITGRKIGKKSLKVLTDIFRLNKRNTEYSRQSKLNFAKLNFRAKRGFSKIIWGGIMVLGYIKKIVGGVLGLPFKIVKTLMKFGPRLGARILLGQGKGFLKKGAKYGLTAVRGLSKTAMGGIAAAALLAYDTYKGVKKSKEWFGPKATTGEKVSSGIGAALGGTSGAFTAKGAAFGALKGAGIGAIVGGPIGAGIGALAGGILGFVGGKNIAKIISSIGSEIKLFSKAIWKLIKMPINLLWESIKLIKNSLTSESTGIMKWVKKAGMWILKPIWNMLTFPFNVFQKVLEFIAEPKKTIYGMLSKIPLIGKYFMDEKAKKSASEKVVPKLPKIPGMAAGGITKDNMLAYLHKGEEVKPKKYVDITVQQLKLLNKKLDPIGKGKSIFRDLLENWKTGFKNLKEKSEEINTKKYLENSVNQLKLLNEKFDPKTKKNKSTFGNFLDNWKTGFKVLKDNYEKDNNKDENKKERTVDEILKSFKKIIEPKTGEKHLQYAKGGLSGRLSLPERIAGMDSEINGKDTKSLKSLGNYLVKKNDTIREITNITGTTWDQLRMWNPDSWGQLPLNHPIYPGGFFFKEGVDLKIYKKQAAKDIPNSIDGVSKSEIARNITDQRKAESATTAKTIAAQNKNILETTNKQNNKNISQIVQSMSKVANSVNTVNNTTQQVVNNNAKSSRSNPNVDALLAGAI